MKQENNRKLFQEARIRQSLGELALGSEDEIVRELMEMSEAEVDRRLTEENLSVESRLESLRTKIVEIAERSREKSESDAEDISQAQPSSDLNEAREAMGWSQAELAKNLLAPLRAIRSLGRGQVLDSLTNARLLERLSRIFGQPQSQIIPWLQHSQMPIPDHYKSAGPPQQLTARPMTWKDLLLDCKERGELTPEQEAFWLSGEDA